MITSSTINNRQKTLDSIFSEAIKDKNLLEAIEAYKMGQAEYERAVSATMTVKIISGTTSNPKAMGELNNADMDRD